MTLLTTSQAAEELGRMEGKSITDRRIRQLCQEGRLGQPFGHTWLITLDELKKFSKKPRKGGRPRKDE